MFHPDVSLIIPLIMLGLIMLPLLLVVGLIIVLARNRSRRPSASQSTPHQPPPSLDQRRQGLERSRSRYREERSRILGMVENGTVTPEEADRLFATLERETSTMACPFCGGDVRIEAIRCKHCQRDLVAGVGQPRQLRKSRDNVLAGVCGGLAEYAAVDSAMMRLLVALVVLFTSILPGLIIYVIAAMVMPDPE
jgi:phage shock protein C